jgi:Lrp/AsnC family transcriptional regulator
VILPTALDDCKRVNAYLPDDKNSIIVMILGIFFYFLYLCYKNAIFLRLCIILAICFVQITIGTFIMDKIDRKILAELQENAAQPVADIARKVGLSVTPCWRRIQRMEEVGLIRKRVALLDPQKMGVGMSVFVAVRTDQHNADWLRNFADMVADMPEVVEFYRMSGEVDYLLRVVVPDMKAYDRFYRTLIANVELTDVSSSFAMEEIKYTTALPLPESDNAN